jgi:hypothetical protein
MDAKMEPQAQEMIEQANAYKGLITVLACRLERSHDPSARRAAAEMRQDWEWQAFNCWYEWHDRCLKVVANDEQYRYEHPSEEIRLEMMRLPPLEEDEEGELPFLAVTGELFWNDPLLARHMGMWTHNPAAMAMLFTCLELMDNDVDVSSAKRRRTARWESHADGHRTSRFFPTECIHPHSGIALCSCGSVWGSHLSGCYLV